VLKYVVVCSVVVVCVCQQLFFGLAEERNHGFSVQQHSSQSGGSLSQERNHV
jgi:hypothetical protein